MASRAPRWLLGMMAIGAVACGGPAAPPVLSPPSSTAAPSMDALPDREWGVVESSRFFVSFPLPDASAWHVDDASGRWLVATHLPSKSMLWARAWRAGSVVGHGACEAEARGWRPDLFGPDASALVDRRRLDAPPGFDAEVGFAVRRAKEALGGVAIAVGAHIRQCLVVAYATRADGVDAPRVLAERLALIAERVFSGLKTRSVEDRVLPVERAGPR